MLAVALIGVRLPAAYAQREKQPFCLQRATGSLNCTYDSLEQCHHILGGGSASGTCIANPARSETTGAGGTRSPGSAARQQGQAVVTGALTRADAAYSRQAASFTYSKSPGLLSIPTRGGAIQLANLPGSST